MAFKYKATVADGNKSVKPYLRMREGSVGEGGGRHWNYFSADASNVVETSGYIDGADGLESQEAVDILSVGDVLWCYELAAIDDTQSIEDDMVGGITALTAHVVLTKTATVINLSDDLWAANVLTYTE